MRKSIYDENYFKEHNKFHDLTVLLLEPLTDCGSYKRKFCICQCSCGKTCRVDRHMLVRTDGNNTKSCGCKRYPKNGNHGSWKGCGDLSATQWNRIKWDAKNRKLLFNISIEYVWNLFEKQEKRCMISGLPIHFRTRPRKFDGNASLDRIDSSKGYIEGNVQWVHVDINFMKYKFDLPYFYDLCKKIVTFQKI